MTTLKNWPERIYLQRHEDCVADDCGPHGEDTTWCSDKINEHDVEYVRADIARSLPSSAAHAGEDGERG
jgi:hypothetical protein